MQENLLQLVYAAIDDVNSQGAKGTLLEKSPESPLLAGKGGVDSLTFVNLVVALEEQVQIATGKSITLVDENSMGLEERPFRTVGSLAAYVEQVLARTELN